jgi:CheY-like chemotaxis protein
MNERRKDCGAFAILARLEDTRWLGSEGLAFDVTGGSCCMFDRKPRLLVIDDEAQILRAYSRVLMHDFVVETEPDAARALRRIAQSPPFDVVLCDRYLAQGLSGQAFFESLRLDLQGRTVMCSGTKPAIDDLFAASLGDRFFLKLGHVSTLISLLLRVAGPSPRAAA